MKYATIQFSCFAPIFLGSGVTQTQTNFEPLETPKRNTKSPR